MYLSNPLNHGLDVTPESSSSQTNCHTKHSLPCYLHIAGGEDLEMGISTKWNANSFVQNLNLAQTWAHFLRL